MKRPPTSIGSPTRGMPGRATAPAARPGWRNWLTIVTERGASDLLLVAGLPPSIRVDGTIRSLPEGPLDGPEIEDAVLPVPRGTFTTSC